MTKVSDVEKYKTKDERKLEILPVMKQLNGLGLNCEIEEIKEFFSICKQYIDSGEGKSGKIKLKGFKRELTYILPTRKQNKAQISLIYNKHI